MPPPNGPPFQLETPIASGRMSDGKEWVLVIGGPSHDLCFGVYIGNKPAVRTDVCNGAPGGAPAPDPYRPLVHDDSRIVPTVFGRVAADVVRVEVVRANGRIVGPQPVIQATGGPYYEVELPDRTPPVAVIGYRDDGTSVRYTVAR